MNFEPQTHAIHIYLYTCLFVIGCGTGVVGLAAALLGADVVLTDESHVLFLINENVDKNKMKSHVEVVEYNWGSALTGALSPAFDMVLISDCVLPKLYPIEPLVNAVAKLVQSNHASMVVLVSFEYRYFPSFDPKERFCTLLHEAHLAFRVIPTSEHHPEYTTEDIELWEITRKT
jgi:hypothetical protein